MPKISDPTFLPRYISRFSIPMRSFIDTLELLKPCLNQEQLVELLVATTASWHIFDHVANVSSVIGVGFWCYKNLPHQVTTSIFFRQDKNEEHLLHYVALRGPYLLLRWLHRLSEQFRAVPDPSDPSNQA